MDGQRIELEPAPGAGFSPTPAIGAAAGLGGHPSARPAPTLQLEMDVQARWVHIDLKRLLDVVVALLLLLALVPVIAVASIVLLVDSPGPLFFRCERVGWRGQPLRILKFRKMRPDAAASERPITVDGDHRLTRVGVWLGKLKLDEIPQLWHVLRGEMSLVGPRPEDPRFVDQHGSTYAQILKVRPGLTGLSQLAFAEESRILDRDHPVEHYLQRILPQKLGMDQLYATRQTIWLDLEILFWTIVTVIVRRPVAVHRETAAMGIRTRRGTEAR